MHAALEANMSSALSDLLRTDPLLPDRFGGETLVVSIALLFVLIIMLLSLVRWRVDRRLLLPGLVEIHAWERLTRAHAVLPATELGAASDADGDVRVVPRTDETATAGPAMVHDTAPLTASTVRPTAAAPNEAPTSTAVGQLLQTTVIPFVDLRADIHGRIVRSQRRALIGAVIVVVAVITAGTI